MAEICLPKGSTFCRSCPEGSASPNWTSIYWALTVYQSLGIKKDVSPYIHSLVGNINLH